MGLTTVQRDCAACDMAARKIGRKPDNGLYWTDNERTTEKRHASAAGLTHKQF